MRALLQRVSEASVRIDGDAVGAIDQGILVLLGVGQEDGPEQAAFLARKVANIRIFEDEAGKMNRSVLDVGGKVLAVSQFTLYADTSRGNRPGFSYAAHPDQANPLYEAFCTELQGHGVAVETGRFQADMKVSLINDGPVTILLDTADR